MNRKYYLLIFILAFPFILHNSVVYPGTTGKITGKVLDAKSGDPLPGANVQVVGTMMGAATDLKGNFIILRLPPGRYSLKVSMMGYQAQIVQNVSVSVDLTTKISFKLAEQKAR